MDNENGKDTKCFVVPIYLRRANSAVELLLCITEPV